MDYFLENPQVLGKQPKRNLADMLQREGILVPDRYENLADARRSGKPIFVRSEHPQDYAGVSDMLWSFDLTQMEQSKIQTDADLQREGTKMSVYFNDHKSKNHFHDFCKLMNLDETCEMQNVSVSLWEKLAGFNRTIFADPAIENRFHIFTYLYKTPILTTYSQVDEFKVTRTQGDPCPSEISQSNQDLIEMYEQIRSLPYFSKADCPIVEAQTIADKNYFIQYHPVFRKQKATHTLNEPSVNQFIAKQVIGATPSQGIIIDTTIGSILRLNDYSIATPQEAAFDNPFENKMFGEIMMPKRKAQFCTAEKNLFTTYRKFFSIHGSVSGLAKPEISVILDGQIRHELKNHPLVRNDSEDEYHTSKLLLHLVSDGNKAYVCVVR